MKKTFNYLLTHLFILIIFLPKNTVSQDNDALWGALAIGAATAIAIEDNKEMLEAVASNYIFANHPEYDEFRLSTIGWGDGGKRISDKGMMRLYPFAITELENKRETKNRKLLLLFASPGWVNEYGLDYTKLSWEIWTDEEWNKLLCIFSNLNSPINLPIESNLIPVLKRTGSREYTSIEVNTFNSNLESYFISNSKGLFYEYKKDENNSNHSIQNLKFTKDGWKLKNKLIYPFYYLKGDDYLVTDYSESLRVFSNEDALGLFLIEEQAQMLVRFTIINKIHQFLNYQD